MMDGWQVRHKQTSLKATTWIYSAQATECLRHGAWGHLRNSPLRWRASKRSNTRRARCRKTTDTRVLEQPWPLKAIEEVDQVIPPRNKQLSTNIKSSVLLKMSSLKSIQTSALAEHIYLKAKSICNFAEYTGILTMGAWARLATAVDDSERRERMLKEARANYQIFLNGQAEFHLCNFQNYRCGGSGAAYLWWKGELPEASEANFVPYVEELLQKAPRDANSILCHPKHPEEGRVFIDIAFAVSPFLLYTGLALQDDELMHRAWVETRNILDVLTFEETGLVNQAINYGGPGHRTEDHWSRGNGWAIHALCALIESLPNEHPDRPEIEKRYVDFVNSCLHFQDAQCGLWHQEMTMPESYIETSGSGLILHGIGVGLAQGILGEKHREAFEKGLRGYLGYIAIDGSIHNTCVGCLCPGQGTKADYMNRKWLFNDNHAFGPAILTFTQAHVVGIQNISIN